MLKVMQSLHFSKRWALIRVAALILFHHSLMVQCEGTEDSDELQQPTVDSINNDILPLDKLQESIPEGNIGSVHSNESSKSATSKETNATIKCKTVCQTASPKWQFLSEVLCSSSGLFIYSICSSEVTCRIEDEYEDLCVRQPSKQGEYRRPKCEEETGCDIPLRCFNFSKLDSDSIVPEPPSVVQVDAYRLQEILENSTMENCCALVMFYAPWCVFSTNFAQKFNALGRAFRELPTLALNYGEHNPNKYVLAYLPVIALYHRGRIVFRFRLSSTYEELIDIVARMTGFIPIDFNYSESELSQPVPTERVDDNIILYLAVCWLVFVAMVFALRSSTVTGCIEQLRSRLRRNRAQVE